MFMNTMTRSLALLSLLAIAACGDSPGRGGLVVPDGGPFDPNVIVPCTSAEQMTGESRLYVLNELAFARPVGSASAGYNVDRDDTVSCNSHIAGETAEFSGVAPYGGEGIDNALGGLLGYAYNSSLQGDINNGSTLLLIEVVGIDDFTNDSCVGVRFLYGRLQPGRSAPIVGHDGLITRDQTFDLSADSFVDGMAGTLPRMWNTGRIGAGRLRWGPANISAGIISHRLSRRGAGETAIRDAQLEFYISDTGLTAGVLGGKILIDQVVAEFSEDPLLATVSGIVSRQAPGLMDIDDNGSPDSCESGSIGMRFAGVPADRGAVVAGRPSP